MDTNQQQKKRKPWYKKLWIIIPLGIFVAPVVIITLIATVYGMMTAVQESAKTNGEKPQQTQQDTIKYLQPEWKITGTEVVGTKYIVASGYLLNTTSETGIADCNIEFYDREIKWAGGKGFGGRELKPNERYDFNVQVEVEHVDLVAKQNINCEDGIY